MWLWAANVVVQKGELTYDTPGGLALQITAQHMRQTARDLFHALHTQGAFFDTRRWIRFAGASMLYHHSSHRLCLQDRVMVRTPDVRFWADKVTMDTQTYAMQAHGHARAQCRGMIASAPQMRYDHARRQIRFSEGVTIETPQGAAPKD